MDDITRAFKGVLFKRPFIDNFGFRFHYLVTAPLLFGLAIAVTLSQYFGVPISCIQGDDIPETVINTYCWIESTFTLPKSLEESIGDGVAYPGVEKFRKGDEVIEHAYYQWVFLVLFLQGLLFLVTRSLWEAWEGGKVSGLLMSLDRPLVDTETIESETKNLSLYFCNNKLYHNHYTIKYIICEVLNFVNVVGQMWLINRFLGGEFTTYGYRVFEFMRMDQQNRTDPMIRVFPRIAKCAFHKFGSSGSVQTHDSLCVLPLNIVNEKIYVFLWLWLVILAIISGLALIYRILATGLPSLRARMMMQRNRSVDKGDVKMAKKYLNFGDWFLLRLLSKNIHSRNFSTFMAVLAKDLNDQGVLQEELKDAKRALKLDYSTLPFEPDAKKSMLA